jgi:hypothetical protein
MADLALRMEHLLVTVAMIRLVSLYRKLCTQKQYVSYIDLLGFPIQQNQLHKDFLFFQLENTAS